MESVHHRVLNKEDDGITNLRCVGHATREHGVSIHLLLEVISTTPVVQDSRIDKGRGDRVNSNTCRSQEIGSRIGNAQNGS